MDCRKTQRLLHLNKEGELTARERSLLADHVRSCMQCASELQRIEEADQRLRALALVRPVVPQPDEFARTVMAKIRRDNGNRHWLSKTMETVLDFFVSPGMRLATAALTVVALGAFAYQEVSLLSGIEALEKKMAGTAVVNTAPTISYSVSSEELRKDPALRLYGDRYLRAAGFNRGDSLVVSRQSLNALIAQFGAAPMNLIRIQTLLGIESKDLHSILNRLEDHATIRVHITLKGT